MKVYISDHQLSHILEFARKKYEVFAVQRQDRKVFFDKLENNSSLALFAKKTIIPFKKILFPNGIDPKKDNSNRKIAFVGIDNCDVWALLRFIKQFEKTNLLPKRENILVIASECWPDKNCFCSLVGTNKFASSDLYIQEEKNGCSIFSGSKAGNSILKSVGIKETLKKPVLKKIKNPEQESIINDKKLIKAIDDKENLRDFWQGISNNCFGCGACTAVCPLCFCTRKDFVLPLDKGEQEGVESHLCLQWDSCFSKRFSEIQNHYDFRPQNLDRLYNWYHHKFVRSTKENNFFLCTGCGRCIEACPANLNIKNIIKSALEKDKDIKISN